MHLKDCIQFRCTCTMTIKTFFFYTNKLALPCLLTV